MFEASHRDFAMRALTAGISLLVGIGAVLSVATAQTAAPKGTKGFAMTKSQSVELGPEIDGMAGRQLRMRIYKIQPGGYVGMHTHKDRPTVVYYLQGSLKVTASDGTSKTFHAGDMSSSGKDTTHWAKNDGKDDVMMLAVDVFHAKK